MKIYLCGPMRGFPQDNHPAFHEAAAKLRELGHTVHSPAEYDKDAGFVVEVDSGTKSYMRHDLPFVLAADAVVVLPGWEKSVGANLEVHVARTCGMPVYDIATVLADVPLEGLVL